MFLHEEGFIHRNVTPHCVYITDAGYCQLADLTCAKKMDGNKVRTLASFRGGSVSSTTKSPGKRC